jgi:hypothetical protein
MTATARNAQRDYELINSYLLARIESAVDAHRQPELLSQVRGAGVEALGEVAFGWMSNGAEWQRSIDEIARFAAEKVLGLKAEPPQLSPVPAPATLANIQRHADAYAGAIAKKQTERAARQAKAPETRTVLATADGAAVREIVKGEVAAFHRTMHRGVWSETARYQQGQMVTRGGSMWSCQKDGASGKPGESADWLLIVKAGRDGRK